MYKAVGPSRGDVNTANNDGVSPVHVAAQLGHVSAVQVLLRLGADPTVTFVEDVLRWTLPFALTTL